jgi:hypothetical protein
VVVVSAVLPEHGPEVPFGDNQHPIQALPSAAADPSLRVRVRPGCHERCQDHLGSVRAEDAVEAAGDLSIVIVDQQAELHPLVFELPAEIPGLLSHPG